MKPVNLLPSEHRRLQPSGSRSGSSYVVLGALAVLLVMVTVYVLTSNKVNERESQAAAASSEADRLEAEARQLGSFQNFAQIRQARLASVQQVAATRFDWERLMRELSRTIPSGSWLQTADASVTGALEGEEPTPGQAAQPEAKLVGCTPHQSDTARMMLRLRRMHRVADVQLNESSQEQGESKPSLESCGTFYKFDLTVSFVAATADEAPRGESRVPAALGGGS